MAFVTLMGIVSFAALCAIAWLFYDMRKQEKHNAKA
jgi:hypothetical protein